MKVIEKMNVSLKKIAEKLHKKCGESIAETLIALLIGSLALVMLASMIQTTNSIVLRSEEKMNEYYEENMGLENPSVGGTITIQIESKNHSPACAVSEQVSYNGNSTFSNNPVFSYAP